MSNRVGAPRRGANPNQTDGSGWTPLLVAADLGHAEVVAVLLKHPDINAGQAVQSPAVMPDSIALHHGIYHQRHSTVEILLEQENIDVNSTELEGQTPLHLAVSTGKTELVQLLLAHPKIKINKQDKAGKSPLALAISAGHAEIVDLLAAASSSIVYPD
jgi:ankyrin repeat protein